MQSLFFRSAKRLLSTPPVSRRAPRLRPRPRLFHHTVPRFVGLNSCPVCAKPLPSPAPACNKCWNIFALPPDLTHHELLGLNYEPNPFIVDIPTLKKHFRETQSICHPDTWATRNPVSSRRSFRQWMTNTTGIEQARCCPSLVVTHKPCISNAARTPGPRRVHFGPKPRSYIRR